MTTCRTSDSGGYPGWPQRPVAMPPVPPTHPRTTSAARPLQQVPVTRRWPTAAPRAFGAGSGSPARRPQRTPSGAPRMARPTLSPPPVDILRRVRDGLKRLLADEPVGRRASWFRSPAGSHGSFRCGSRRAARGRRGVPRALPRHPASAAQVPVFAGRRRRGRRGFGNLAAGRQGPGHLHRRPRRFPGLGNHDRASSCPGSPAAKQPPRGICPGTDRGSGRAGRQR